MPSQSPPDLVILDLGLPDMDGQEVLRQLREWLAAPIIVLSARDQEQQKIAALDHGADDYLTKPFSTGELLARIRVALRHAARVDGGEPGATKFEIGDLKVDLAARRVFADGSEVHLTPIEFKLLTTLVHSAGKVLTHRQLLKEVWGPQQVAGDALPARLHGQPAPQARSRPGPAALSAHRARRRLSAGERVNRLTRAQLRGAARRPCSKASWPAPRPTRSNRSPTSATWWMHWPRMPSPISRRFCPTTGSQHSPTPNATGPANQPHARPCTFSVSAVRGTDTLQCSRHGPTPTNRRVCVLRTADGGAVRDVGAESGCERNLPRPSWEKRP